MISFEEIQELLAEQAQEELEKAAREADTEEE